jgi:hypothetical protein
MEPVMEIVINAVLAFGKPTLASPSVKIVFSTLVISLVRIA